MKPRSSALKGFTLIELLLVVAIVAIISGAVVPLFKKTKQNAKIAKFLMLVETLKTACQYFYFQNDFYANEHAGDPTDCQDTSKRQLSCAFEGDFGGPFINSPLTYDDNPFSDGDEEICVITRKVTFDFDGNGTGDTPPGEFINVLYVEYFPFDAAKEIDAIFDSGIPGIWEETGRVRVQAEEVPPNIVIFLYVEY